MSDSSKWISGLSPDQPASEAALQVLKPRLDAVASYFPLGVAPPSADIEPVHQLRVSTRRAGAALRLFREVLPHRWGRKARQVLRTLRQSAGQARDWDVFHQRLRGLPELAANPVRPLLLGVVIGQRLAAQSQLDHLGIHFELQLADVIRSLPEPDELPRGGPTLKELGDVQLVEFLLEFSSAVESRPTTPEHLHQLRILGKRVRYALEIFGSCYGEHLKNELYPRIEALQEILGGVQDAEVGLSRLAAIQHLLKVREPSLMKPFQSEFKAVCKAFAEVMSTQKRAFRDWLKHWQPFERQKNWSAWLQGTVQLPRLGIDEPTGGTGSDNPPGAELGRGGGSSSSGPTTGPTPRRSPRPAGKPSPRDRVRGSTSGKSGSRGRSG